MASAADTAPTSVKSPTQNKSMAAGAGGVTGGGAGVLLIWALDLHGVTISPEAAAALATAASTVAAWFAAFFVPIITAAQQAALRKLESEQ